MLPRLPDTDGQGHTHEVEMDAPNESVHTIHWHTAGTRHVMADTIAGSRKPLFGVDDDEIHAPRNFSSLIHGTPPAVFD